jgi:hypothetical protein
MNETAHRPPLDLVQQSFVLYGPGCRWRMASELRPIIPRCMAKHYDQYVRDAHDYIRLCRTGTKGRQRAVAKYPLIAKAEELQKNEAVTAQLQIAVLGELENSEIVRRFGVEQPVLETWERLYFDARGQRGHTGWVHAEIICPAQREGKAEFAARLKLVAAAGPVAARAILDSDSRAPLQEGERLFDRRLKLHLKFDAACDMPLTSSRDQMAFIRMHVEMKGQEQKLQLQERKLQQRCREASNKHELATMRLELARERDERRAAALARRDEERALVREGARISKDLQAEQWRAEWQAERDAATARAASSPLAALTWGGSGTNRVETPKPEPSVALGVDDHEMVAVIRLMPRQEVDPARAVVAVPA